MTRQISATLCAFALAVAAFPACAADTASGTLKMTSEGKPVRIDIKHVHYITGPDSFAPALTTRRLIFTTEDTRPAINACETARCAMYSIGNGMTFELEADSPAARWWVQVRPTQQSGMGNASIVSLSTDTPERVAGTLTIDSLGVNAKITFDAGLVRAFEE